MSANRETTGADTGSAFHAAPTGYPSAALGSKIAEQPKNGVDINGRTICSNILRSMKIRGYNPLCDAFLCLQFSVFSSAIRNSSLCRHQTRAYATADPRSRSPGHAASPRQITFSAGILCSGSLTTATPNPAATKARALAAPHGYPSGPPGNPAPVAKVFVVTRLRLFFLLPSCVSSTVRRGPLVASECNPRIELIIGTLMTSFSGDWFFVEVGLITLPCFSTGSFDRSTPTSAVDLFTERSIRL
jgi:hypothetical protein